MKRIGKTAAPERRGSVTIATLIIVVVLLTLCGASLANSLRGKEERGSAVDRHRAEFVADAGIAHAITNLSNDDEGDIGDELVPIEFGGGSYWATVVDNEDETFTVTSTGLNGNEMARIEARLEPLSGGIYTNAVFAGNSSGDPGYVLDMGGEDGQADYIGGDVFSGGSFDQWGDAVVTGTVRASLDITGTTGEEGSSQPIPDLGAMNYDATADFDVADLFADEEYWTYDNAGGSAYQVPEDNPAHIFRKNPTDRATNTSSTEKDDFFLEDPYESVRVDSSQNGSDPYTFSFTGIGGESGPDSNGKVFYVDGNLWVHNKKTYSLGMKHTDTDGVQITFVVSGNIYFSDNLFYKDAENDGLAFIAMVDDDVDDSGNIYFGDPVFGTLQQMNAFMYAENNFYDMNLDESGSEVVRVNGNMTAGNQVVIERDYGSEHTKLHVDFDDRIATGAIEMPGLPGGAGAGDPEKYIVTYWHRIANP